MRGKNVVTAMDFLITRLHQLGGKCLSEPCKAWCTALLLHLSGMDHATESSKQQVLDFFKKEYARRGRRVEHLEPYIQELPPPSLLKVSHPSVYQALYHGGGPAPSQIDVISSVLPVVYCRSTHKTSQALQRLQSQEDVRRGDGGPPLRLMEQIVSLQQDNLHLIRQQGVASSSALPLSLKALQAPPAATQGERTRSVGFATCPGVERCSCRRSAKPRITEARCKSRSTEIGDHGRPDRRIARSCRCSERDANHGSTGARCKSRITETVARGKPDAAIARNIG